MREQLSRRRLVQLVGAAGAAGLAGCSDQSGNNGGSDLGERVPSFVVNYMGNLGDTATIEEILPLVADDYKQLGLTVKNEPKDVSNLVNDVIEDKHTHNAWWTRGNTIPSRLEPLGFADWVKIDGAGSGGYNASNWADCEVTNRFNQAEAAASTEEVKEHLGHVFSRMSEEGLIVPVADKKPAGAYHNGVTTRRMGQFGPTLFNHFFYAYSEPPSGENALVVGVPTVLIDQDNFTHISDSVLTHIWNKLVHTTLLTWDEEYNLTTEFLNNYEISDDGTTYEFELGDGTFHNGDPITAEDVAWSLEFLMDSADTSIQRAQTPIASTEVIDDKNLTVTLEEARRSFTSITLARWGVLHKDSWVAGGAPDNPADYTFDPTQQPGSGPFKVASRTPGTEMVLTPHDGHPAHQPSHDVILRAFDSDQGMLRALENGEIHVAPSISFGLYLRAKNDIDGVNATAVDGFTAFMQVNPWHRGPTKFREFRHALGKVVNRRRISQSVFDGESVEPTEGTYVLANNPFVPDDVQRYTDDPTGDLEGARQLLSDEGWGWDSNDNLRYPPDADLAPKWPEGGNPDPANYPCLNDNGEYVPPGDQ